MDNKKHKIILAKLLLELFKHKEIAQRLVFKGGTCAMFFYGLPRMSIDLDFDLTGDSSDYRSLLPTLIEIISKFGNIDDYKDKFYAIYFELNYGFGEKNMKIEISKRGVSGRSVLQNFLGENILILHEEDLFTNKLVALLHRSAITNRDIFDIRYFLQKGVSLNTSLLKEKFNLDSKEYIQSIKEFISGYNFGTSLYGLGELLDEEQKKFMKTKMKDQIIGYLDMS